VHFLKQISYEQRLEAVLNVTEKHMSQQEAADLLGTARAQVQRWLKRYERFGAEGLLLRNGSYAGEFKINVIEYMHIHQLSISETAVIFGVPKDSTVGTWERIYLEKGRDALLIENRGKRNMTNEVKPKKAKTNRQAEEDLIAEVQRLRMENAYLKKLNALVLEKIQRENGKKQ